MEGIKKQNSCITSKKIKNKTKYKNKFLIDFNWIFYTLTNLIITKNLKYYMGKIKK